MSVQLASEFSEFRTDCSHLSTPPTPAVTLQACQVGTPSSVSSGAFIPIQVRAGGVLKCSSRASLGSAGCRCSIE